ncbi:Decapping nuclease [Aphelenchoides bicaudatus]|nr:Decapping nuclease [Aphelenchoides bicaudatus]
MSGRPSIVAEHVGSFVNDMEAGKVFVDNFEWRRLYKQYEHENGRQNLHLDLNHNFETFKHDPVYNGRINPLLSYIRQSAKSTNLREAVQGCDFVTNRGALKSIGVSFYSQERGWQIVCCKFQDIVFMCEAPTEEHQKERMNDTEADHRFTYMGHKFENYLLSDSPEVPPNTEEPVSTLAPQYGVFKSTGTANDGSKMTFLMNAEMDGMDQNNNFLELKTMKQPPKKASHHKNPNWFFEYRCNWWLQSYLVGIERIIVGMRNQEGIVSSVRELNTNSVAHQKRRWHPSVCLTTLFNCLKDVRGRLDTLPELSTIKLTFSAENGRIDISEIEENESAHFKFLPDDFVEYFSQQDVSSQSTPIQNELLPIDEEVETVSSTTGIERRRG